MINFDFNSYIDINKNDYKKYLAKKEEIINKLNTSNMNGWLNDVDNSQIKKIIEYKDYIKNNSDLLVVIGIGGSYLPSYAFNKALLNYFKNDFEVIYVGYSLSSNYMNDLLEYIKDRKIIINVISKSGNTLETSITYDILNNFMIKKYGEEETINRTIITTDKNNGLLREKVNKYNYKSLIIPNNIGGRYSFLTPAHLLVLSLNYDINKIIKGYQKGLELIDSAFNYAINRRCLFDKGKYIENFCIFDEKLLPFVEFLKQLFGESEGKNRKGIFPTSSLYSRDLHSLGQFIQDGNNIIFETYIYINNNSLFKYKNTDLDSINNIVLDSVIKAHYDGGVTSNIIKIDNLNEESISMLISYFMLSAAFSAYLFDIEPFDQPGVEIYKKNIKENLKI